MTKINLYFLVILISNNVFAQDCPYKINAWVDIPVTVGGGGLAFLGLTHLNKKGALDSMEVSQLNPGDINKFDRSATHQRNSSIGTYGDIGIFSGIFAGPAFIFANTKTRKDYKTVGLIYLETMVVMANVYTWTIGSINRNRPYLYNPNVPLHDKLVSHTRNSFFAGHPAATAAGTFFVAKVFHDYYPNSKARKFVWAGAFIPSILVAYCRYKDGQHFPTDIAVGIPLGAVIGILVPQLHKSKKTTIPRAQIFPTPRGMGMVYHF